MKAILISIKPKWVAKILNGEKTIEIRKTMPKCDLPIDVHIYCTKDDNLCCIKRIDRDRYICGKDFDLRDFPHLSSGYDGKGKVVAKFTLKEIRLAKYQPYVNKASKKANELTCLTDEELDKYLNKKDGYGWVIDNLVIFDKPKELNEFCGKGYEERLKRELEYSGDIAGIVSDTVSYWYRIKKAPQNFCYVEVRQ